MKGALLLTLLLGALVAIVTSCPTVPYHSCVKSSQPKKCVAIEICEDPHKEKCGYDYCEYPSTCATVKRQECQDFKRLKTICENRKVCKEVKKPCGYGECSLYQDCVKETVCVIKKPVYGRKLLDASSKSGAVSKGGYASSEAVAIDLGGGYADAESGALSYGGGAESKSVAISVGKKDGYGYPEDDGEYGYGYHEDGEYGHGYHEDGEYGHGYHEDGEYGHGYHEGGEYGYHGKKEDPGSALICKDKFVCVAKEPCVDITIHKCVVDYLKPGIDICHGGHDFDWYSLLEGELCGEEFCGPGYKCAEIQIQKCKKPCGNSYCDYGYDCVADDHDECKDFHYLETVCRDVYEPSCVQLDPYCLHAYKPPCKTVFKCEEEENVCGNQYCGAGYVCAVDYKKSCDDHYDPYPEYGKKVVVGVEKKKDPYGGKKAFPVSVAKSGSYAGPEGAKTDTYAGAKHGGKAKAGAKAKTKKSYAGSKSGADGETGEAYAGTEGESYGYDEQAESTAGADVYGEDD